ncbi:MAG: hypothetical protein ACLQGN_15575 [Mycobacterium sp.]
MQLSQRENSRFYFTFFEVPKLPIPDRFSQGEVVTHFLSDPFHYNLGPD